jgi:hypothetical protein
MQRRINSFDGAAAEESSACCGVNLAVPFRFAIAGCGGGAARRNHCLRTTAAEPDWLWLCTFKADGIFAARRTRGLTQKRLVRQCSASCEVAA